MLAFFCVHTLLEVGLSYLTYISYLPQVRPTVNATEFIENARVLKVWFDTFISR